MATYQARELKPSIEYVSSDRLQKGSIYFTVTYVDDLGLIPRLEPYVFLGWNLSDGDEDQIYFQDAVSYAAGIRLSDEEGVSRSNAFIFSGSANTGCVMEFGEALDTLIKCELRRREAAPLVANNETS